MSLISNKWILALIIAGTATTAAFAITIPAEENFDVNNSNWRNSASAPATYFATGGADGGGFIQASYTFSTTNNTTPVVFRGHNEFNASGGAFVGDWIDARANLVRAYVRHDLPIPTQFFVRAADPGFFPGVIAVDFTPVLPNVWTLVEFDLSHISPQIVSTEGELLGHVLDNIGKLQFGPVEPASLADSTTPYTFQLDQIFVVPEPTSVAMIATLVVGGLCLGGRRRK